MTGWHIEANNDIFSQLSPSYENRQVTVNFVSNPIEEVSRGVKNYRSGKNVLLLSECEDGKNKNESYSFPANNLVMWHHFFTPISQSSKRGGRDIAEVLYTV